MPHAPSDLSQKLCGTLLASPCLLKTHSQIVPKYYSIYSLPISQVVSLLSISTALGLDFTLTLTTLTTSKFIFLHLGSFLPNPFSTLPSDDFSWAQTQSHHSPPKSPNDSLLSTTLSISALHPIELPGLPPPTLCLSSQPSGSLLWYGTW